MRTIYFQLQYGHIFCGDTAVVPYDTANAINAHELSVKIGIAIIIPMPVIPITTPIIDSIKPQKMRPNRMIATLACQSRGRNWDSGNCLRIFALAASQIPDSVLNNRRSSYFF